MNSLYKKRNKKFFKGIIFYTVLVIIVFIITFPLIWVILTSLKSHVDTFRMPPKWIFTPTLVHYHDIFTKHPFLNYILNSIIVSFSSTALSLIVGLPAAYGLTRFQIKRNKDIAFFILSTRMAPATLVILPFFILFRSINLIDNLLSLIVLYMIFNLSFVVWMMRGFLREIPTEIDEAAMIDGCSRFLAFIKIIIPLCRSGIIATSIFCLVMSWNEFIFALVLTGQKTRTLPVAITTFIEFSGTHWGQLTAAGTIAMIPLIVFSILTQRQIIRGMTMGAVER